MKYICFSPEICPETKKDHWQGYFYLLGKGMTLRTIKKKISAKWNLRPAKGSAKQNQIYCGSENYEKDNKIKLKNNLFEEFGIIPHQGKRIDLDEMHERIKKGVSVETLRQESPESFHQYGRTMICLENDYLRRQSRNEMPRCIWYYGKTGVGKSHMAFTNYNVDTDYILNVKDNGFWEDYYGQKRVIINEFRGELAFSDLLQICDKWPYYVKRKGQGRLPLLAVEIIITSCKRPEEIYTHSLDDEENIDQFLRRCQVIELKKKELM